MVSTALDRLTREGTLWMQQENGAVRCTACAHRCLIRSGRRGICGVRFNESGRLMVPWGYVAGAQIDPIEKKPFNHFLPGGKALTFGMLGCNFHCSFCQNWQTSQALRDPLAGSASQYVSQFSAPLRCWIPPHKSNYTCKIRSCSSEHLDPMAGHKNFFCQQIIRKIEI